MRGFLGIEKSQELVKPKNVHLFLISFNFHCIFAFIIVSRSLRFLEKNTIRVLRSYGALPVCKRSKKSGFGVVLRPTSYYKGNPLEVLPTRGRRFYKFGNHVFQISWSKIVMKMNDSIQF